MLHFLINLLIKQPSWRKKKQSRSIYNMLI